MKKKSKNDVDTVFYTNIPNLTGEEEVIAHAGEGKDFWDEEQTPTPSFYQIRPLDKEGNITPEYKKLIEQLHFVDAKPCGRMNIGPSEFIYESNMAWRNIQANRKRVKAEANKRIERMIDGYIREDIIQ